MKEYKLYYVCADNICDTQKEKILTVVSEKTGRAQQEALLSAVGRQLTFYALSEYTGLPRKKINIFRDDSGKPQTDIPGVFFNISHSFPYVICAVAPRPIGVDVEKIREFPRRVAQRVFTGQEIEEAEKSSNPDAALFSLWTQRESAVKMTGDGISGMWDGFSLPPGSEISFPFIAEGYTVCVCLQKRY